MNELIIKEISKDLNITEKQVTTVLSLLSDGNTIPFIARYRKEDVIRLIDEKGLLTEELKNSILACSKLVEVEDLYRPYKEKKKTKGSEAIKLGLEPLAKMIMSFPEKGSMDDIWAKAPTSKEVAIENRVIASCGQGTTHVDLAGNGG